MIIKRRTEQASLLTDSDLDPLLQRIYSHRGIQSTDELSYELPRLLSYHQLKGIEDAASILADAIISDRKILVVGDFDADGATSSALAISALEAMGVKHCHYLVPNRFTYGYGLTPEIVEAAAFFNPDVIVTVDNGISSIAGVDAAKSRGWQVVITDHHLPGETLPLADAIVNPNQPGCPFPSKHIAGVGVIFYVMTALRAELQARSWFNESRSMPKMTSFLDLVALGTVADVVTLDFNNRLLVDQGLKRIRQGLARPGIQALLLIGKREANRLSPSDLGFAVAPRLNAAGRLDDMSLGISCLLEKDFSRAIEKAEHLDQLNQERRAIEQDMQAQAMQLIDKLSLKENQTLPMGLCLYDANWHQGVIGILAGRIKEKFHRPVIVFAKSSESEVKGSARSVNGVHIRDVLDYIASHYPGMISKFGGHAMAAGLTLPLEKLSQFASVFAEAVALQLTPEAVAGTIYSDGELSQDDFTLSQAMRLRQAGPWGQHFPEPAFDGEFKLIAQRPLSQGKHFKLTLQPKGSSQLIEGMLFNASPDLNLHRVSHVKAVYRLDVNEYQEHLNLQLLIEHLEPIT